MKDFPADMSPNYPNEQEVELVHIDIHRAMFLRFEVEQESGYKKTPRRTFSENQRNRKRRSSGF